MKASTFRTNATIVRILTLGLAVLVFDSLIKEANGQTHTLRANGRKLVEAEAYSKKSSVDSPKVGEGDNCSGKRYLGYFWGNQWFELHLNVPQTLNYQMAFRASSGDGSQIQVQMIDKSGNEVQLATVNVPKTGEYTKFVNVRGTIVSLPKGVCTLRFKNTTNGVDIDHITFSAGSEDDVVSTTPAVNSGADINPLKGFQSGWWRENDDYASVGFQYLEWGKLEPKDDVFDWDYVEEVLDRPGTQGRHVILQLAVDGDDWDAKEPVGDSHYKGPDWLLKKVGENVGPALPDEADSRTSRATKYDHPDFILESTEAIKALCDHFKNDPRTFVLQAGVVGYWGEWHTFPRMDWSPSDSTKQSILGAYIDNLGPDQFTQIRYPDEPIAKPTAGLGYTNGSATLTEHGLKFGKAINAGELWKNGPVSGEWPPNVDLKHWKNFFLTDEGTKFIEQGHYSALLLPEPKHITEKLTDWKQDKRFMEMHRRLGYNFQAKAVRHLVAADQSGQVHIEVDLHNSGIAPFYKNWEVQLGILNSETGEVIDLIETDTDIRTLAPDGLITIVGSSSEKLDANTRYQIGMRILQPRADKKKTTKWNLNQRNTYIALANKVKITSGKWDQDYALQGGWNLLGRVERRKPEQAKPVEGPFFPLEGSFRPVEDNIPQPGKGKK